MVKQVHGKNIRIFEHIINFEGLQFENDVKEINCCYNTLQSFKGIPPTVENLYCMGNKDLIDISDLPTNVTELDLSGCPNVTKFPKEINTTLTLKHVNDQVYKILNQDHIYHTEVAFYFDNIAGPDKYELNVSMNQSSDKYFEEI